MTKAELEEYAEKTQDEIDALLKESFKEDLTNEEKTQLAEKIQSTSNLIRSRIGVILSQIDFSNQKKILEVLSHKEE